MMAPKAIPVNETMVVPKVANEADRKFILALVVIAAFVALLAVPLIRGDSTFFTTVATAMTGLVGTIIGYYFGSEKTQSPNAPNNQVT